ncbi:mitochondrial ribosomal protein l24 [Plakobranchus ocellatus]|uniref:Mitochondrial ribosomal protein l24 n=1 Tax=Plakobranchus ocellatus TaxID=259542 RepID=A0AAV4AE46_9GAST|nr:mitochondrial ribosomal protein l24 [Plakobranchus ocellatus]
MIHSDTVTCFFPLSRLCKRGLWPDPILSPNRLPCGECPGVTGRPAEQGSVQILKGIDRGKQGLVCAIIRERNWCYVEGLNCSYKWVNRSASSPGFMSKVEKPLLVTTEVSLLDPSDLQPTEIEWRYDEDGNRVRVSSRSGRVVPMSERADNESEDMIDKGAYIEQSWDTKEKELTKVTFKPKAVTFEADIMESMGIKEDRKRAPNFYY